MDHRLISLLDQLEQSIARRIALYEADIGRIATELSDLKDRAVVTVDRSVKPLEIIMCNKRQYGSESAAKQACQTLGHTVRSYKCGHCGKYHITKREYS